MKPSEFKLKIITGLNNLIDTYFNSNNITDKLINSTLKVMIKQKSFMLDDAIQLFTDINNEIDEYAILDEYSNLFSNDQIIIDIRDFINNDFIKGLLPDKALIIKIDDIIDMLK